MKDNVSVFELILIAMIILVCMSYFGVDETVRAFELAIKLSIVMLNLLQAVSQKGDKKE